MNEMMSEEERKMREERERKKAEVRARLEASSKSKQKKGFMTPERKKKLRLLLRKKAAEELKRQQEVKATERRRVIAERTGPKKNLDDLDEKQLQDLCKQYHEKIAALESDKYDLEYHVKRIDYDIHELSTKVNDMRGKFTKPPLKKVPKFGVKIERMLLNARKEVGFSVNLKAVKRDQFKAETESREGDNTPEWSWKKQGGPDQSTDLST
ncbi:hypothetical protein GZH46_01585 [Fragariocoptes setiger]|uniref:Troponin I n=1 Tax=Fragariocoptes setiger TaxID=1670756 RepID=A0ABQ7S8X7_9ACAR|nr:hypothetical protein GZH46_01585 [Fragariocoptes setiger]